MIQDQQVIEEPSQAGRWTEQEHQLFLQGLAQYGKNWKLIEKMIQTRNGSQIRSHAQKYYLKMNKLSQDPLSISTKSTATTKKAEKNKQKAQKKQNHHISNYDLEIKLEDQEDAFLQQKSGNMFNKKSFPIQQQGIYDMTQQQPQYTGMYQQGYSPFGQTPQTMIYNPYQGYSVYQQQQQIPQTQQQMLDLQKIQQQQQLLQPQLQQQHYINPYQYQQNNTIQQQQQLQFQQQQLQLQQQQQQPGSMQYLNQIKQQQQIPMQGYQYPVQYQNQTYPVAPAQPLQLIQNFENPNNVVKAAVKKSNTSVDNRRISDNIADQVSTAEENASSQSATTTSNNNKKISPTTNNMSSHTNIIQVPSTVNIQEDDNDIKKQVLLQQQPASVTQISC